MGFFGAIKKGINLLTGGGADVTVAALNVENPISEPIQIMVTAVIKDNDIKIDKVYLRIRAVERVVARDIDLAREADGSIERYTEDVENEFETYSTEMSIAGADTLEAGQSYEWIAEVNLPQTVNPTYRGQNAWHEWQIYAGLDCRGNDPDSNWKSIDVIR